jgi:heparin/heparan-sulfate lyase
MEEPKVQGDSFTVTLSQRGWTGKLVNKVVLPSASEIVTVGGPGKEFWVFGENFPNQPRGAHIATAEPGEWRVEVSPRQPAETDYFLNVLQPMEASSDRLPVESIQSGEVVGIQVANRVVLFNRESAAIDRPVSFPVRGQGTFGILVTDLAEGTWQVWRDGAIVNPALSVSASEGTLWLQGPAGNYTLRR